MTNLILKIGYNTLIQSLGKVISVLLGIVSISLITRYLGVSGYGDFTLAFTYVSFFSIISDFGLQIVMVRELAQGKTDSYAHFFSLKLLLIALALLIGSVSLIFLPYSQLVKMAFMIALISVSISGLASYGTSIFQSRVRLDLVTLVDVASKIVTVIFMLLFIHLRTNLLYIVGSVLIGNLVGLLITYLLLRPHFVASRNFREMKKIVGMMIPIGVMALVGTAYFKIDTILLSLLKNSSDVGIYSISYKVLENILVLWGFYMASAFPILSKLNKTNDKPSIKELLKKSFLIAFMFSIALIGVVNLFSGQIISILAGNGFSGSSLSLKILVFSLPFLFINNLISDFYIVMKKNQIIFVGIFISLILNVILNLIFIPKYGFIAASVITVVSAAAQSLYSVSALLTSKTSEFSNK